MTHFPFSEAAQDFVEAHALTDVTRLALKYKDVDGVPISLLIDQILGRRKAKTKIPEFYHESRIVFPPSLNLEQSSSEATAQWKASLILPGTTGVDLSGGFGVDARWMSRRFDQYEFVEPDASLLAMAQHNLRTLGCTNIIYHARTAEQFLETSTRTFDFIYVDPSRRNKRSNRVVTFENCQPDVIRLLDLLYRKTGTLMIKASPLLDIDAGLISLRRKFRVIVLAVKNECKEVLFIKDSTINDNNTTIEAIDIGADVEFRFSQEEEKLASATIGPAEKFIYEPNAAVLKAGAFKLLTSRYGAKKLHANTHLYTSGNLIEGFPGRCFEVETELKPDRKAAESNFPDGYANVISRNHPLSADELKKKMGLADGGNFYLIAFSSTSGRHLVRARRVS